MSVNKRGPYKQYLYEEHNPEIPASTALSRKRRHDHSQENPCSDGNTKCSKLSRIEEITVAGSSNEVINEVGIIPTVLSEKNSDSESLQSSDGEVDDISLCLSHKGDDSSSRTDNSSENEIDLASDMDEYEEIPTADEDDNNVIDNADDHDQDPYMEQFRQVPYEGCNFSKEESKMLLVSFALRHQLTDAALESLIQVIDCHLPRIHHGSKYLLLKSLPESKACKYYYCPECYTILNSCTDNRMKCEVCTTIYKEKYLDKRNKYFMHIPLKKQLVKSKDFAQFRKTKEMESDVINGNIYRNLRSKNIIGDNEITLQWNSDRVQLFKSSTSSIWPILVTINELPYRLRRQHILLAGIWFDTSVKANMNIFLQPFIDELIDLHNNGFITTTFMHKEAICIKVHTLVAPVDSIARSMIQNMKQFNGKYGCSYCYNKGKVVKTRSGGFKRVYCGDLYALRQKHLHNKHVKKSISKNHSVKGVKGPSVTQLIPLFNIIKSFPPEYMHSVTEGAIKQFVLAWFDSSNHDKEWYLGKYQQVFDNKLTSILPPSEITRIPRSIVQRKLFKASEWKNVLLYYSLLCLTGLMPQKFIKHWLLFVFSMNIFLQAHISDNKFIAAEQALQTFVLQIEELYGNDFMNYNIHLLLHIPASVKNYGAFWAWSTFHFEGFNRTLKTLFNGSQCIAQQICKFYSRLRFINNNRSTFTGENCSSKGKAIFDSLMKVCHIKRCTEYENSLKAFGIKKEIVLTAIQKLVVEELIGEPVESTAFTFDRFIFRNILYHTLNYTRLLKRYNSTILTENGLILDILHLCTVIKANDGTETNLLLCKEYCILPEEVCKNNRVSSISFSFITKKTDNIRGCLLDMIRSKCIVIPYSNGYKQFIIPVVNTIETD